MRRTGSSISFGLGCALALLLTCVAPAVQAQPVEFGSRTLAIPAPAGFVPVSRDLPGYMQVSQGFLPPTNRLVEAYLAPEDKAVLAGGEQRFLTRFFQLQTLRSFDGQPLSAADFTTAMGQAEAQIAALVPHMDAETAKLTEQGNKGLGGDAEVALGGMRYLGMFRREPWGLFFTTSIGIELSAEGRTHSQSVVSGAALVLVNHQLLYLYANADDSDPQARAWAERSVSTWADAIRAANPDDPAVAARATRFGRAFDWGRVGGKAIVGGVIGALVALVIGLFRRGK